MITGRSKNHWIGSTSSCGMSSRPVPSVAGGGGGSFGGVHAFTPTVHLFPPTPPHFPTRPRTAGYSTTMIARRLYNDNINWYQTQSGRNGQQQQQQQQQQQRLSSSFINGGLVPFNDDDRKIHVQRKKYGWGETTSAAPAVASRTSIFSSTSLSSSFSTMVETTTNWRTYPTINPTLKFRTLRVPIQDVAFWLKHPKLQPYYAYHHRQQVGDDKDINNQNRMNDDDDDDDGSRTVSNATVTTTILSHIHPRLKIVQDDDDDDDVGVENEKKPPGRPVHKLLLLWMVEKDVGAVNEVVESGNSSSSSSSSSRNSELEQKVQSIIDEINSSSLEEKGPRAASFGPIKSIPITYRNLSYGYILRQLLSSSKSSKQQQEEEQEESSSSSSIDVASTQNIPTSYEQVGHVAHFNLRKQHLPYGKLIGEVLLESATGRGGSSGGSGGDTDTSDGGGSNSQYQFHHYCQRHHPQLFVFFDCGCVM
eukprot:CAMPEP_0113458828 /NCGR_PEP_ID=MMETSP0014_2-20120614/10125_1 /TAXON_ID=2857 /ORGANISM="Nitzschia sp." /LENGTH=477 /DNA_ID=CAMNT_0000350367 /DNA_START=103 /DNA_END=1536 /DNA_ORIENTATION=+ /assembly_acc=CAM_ASM_000159